MQNIDEMLSLLFIIKHGSNSSEYLNSKLGFVGVGGLCMEAKSFGYITEDNRKFTITEQGLEFINKSNFRLNRKNMDKAIAQLPDAFCKQISIDDIYLPDNF